MKASIITSYEPAKVISAEKELGNMKQAKMIGEWDKVRKITKVVWNFETEEDAREVAPIFMNRFGFEYVQRP